MVHIPSWLRDHWGVGLVLLFVNSAGIFLYALEGDINTGTIVAGITAISLAALAGIKMVTPAIVDAIKTIGPALQELHKQREELSKGSLFTQIDKLQADLTAMGQRVEDANQKLHDARNQANFQVLQHVEEVKRLQAMLDMLADQLKATRIDLQSARDEIQALRIENERLLKATLDQVQSNTEELDQIKTQGESVQSTVGRSIRLSSGDQS